MFLNEDTLKLFLKEHGELKTFGTIKKADAYVYDVKSGGELTYGYLSMDRDGKLSFKHTEMYATDIRYNIGLDRLQYMSNTEHPQWRTLHIYTEGLCKEIYITGETDEEIVRNYKKAHPDEIKKYINDLIAGAEKYVNDINKKIKFFEEEKVNSYRRIKELKNIFYFVSIPDYMENINEGDLFETRNGTIVRFVSFSVVDKFPQFSPVQQLDGCAADYCYTTAPNGMIDYHDMDDDDDDYDICESELDIIKKL